MFYSLHNQRKCVKLLLLLWYYIGFYQTSPSEKMSLCKGNSSCTPLIIRDCSFIKICSICARNHKKCEATEQAAKTKKQNVGNYSGKYKHLKPFPLKLTLLSLFHSAKTYLSVQTGFISLLPLYPFQFVSFPSHI